MSDLQVNAIRGIIAQMPEDDQRAVENSAEFLRIWLKDSHSRMMAMALVGAEMAAKT